MHLLSRDCDAQVLSLVTDWGWLLWLAVPGVLGYYVAKGGYGMLQQVKKMAQANGLAPPGAFAFARFAAMFLRNSREALLERSSFASTRGRISLCFVCLRIGSRFTTGFSRAPINAGGLQRTTARSGRAARARVRRSGSASRR